MDGLVHRPTLNLLMAHSKQVTQLLAMPWLSHNSLVVQIRALLEDSPSYHDCNLSEINLAGAPDSQFFYTVDPQHLIILTTKSASIIQPFIKELMEIYEVRFNLIETETAVLYISEFSNAVETRLHIPHILLINLFHPEMYPTFRFTLGISSIASFLRHNNCAKVDLIDCQFGATVTELTQHVLATRPNIVGLSVNFGQIDLMEQFLDGIYREKPSGYEPIIVLGNILPALCSEQILEKYPQVVICSREGEIALTELSRRYQIRDQWRTIPNICYKDSGGKLVRTRPDLMPLEILPPPALDTIEALMNREGVLTAEFSRGCQYNICTFCPRTHKGNAWRSLPVSSMIQQSVLFHKVSQHFQVEPYIFLADEEFVGPDQKRETLSRIYSLLDGLQSLNIRVSFDVSCRADQIYNERRDEDWHIERGNLFRRWVNSGLSRLFVGIESGTDNQLERYRKGYSSESVISAIRYFSLLGVQLRFGFIFFDPLMTVQDLCENIEFLGRSDIVLTQQPDLSVKDIFERVRQSHGTHIEMPSNGSVYENVSYMISPLEVLPKSKYLLDLKKHNPGLLAGETDMSFARIPVRYLIPEIELLSKACQIWINFCFPIVYTLKGLQKVSQGEYRDLLADTLKEYRYLSYILVRSLAQSLDLIKSDSTIKWEEAHQTPPRIASVIQHLHDYGTSDRNNDAINSVLFAHANLFKEKIAELGNKAASLPSVKKDIWDKISTSWLNTSILDTSALRKK